MNKRLDNGNGDSCEKIVMFEGGVETLAYFSKQMAGQFEKMGYAVFSTI